MSNGVNQYERVLLICSEKSLDRNGVLNELQETIDREAVEGASSRLIPVALDDKVFSDWAPGRPQLERAVKSRVIADFRGVWEDEALFEKAIDRLIAAIQRTD